MFIDYKKIVNLIIEELINNNAYSSKLLMSNLQKARLINAIIDNMKIEKNISNKDFIYNLYLFDKKLGNFTSRNNYGLDNGDKYNLLKLFLFNNVNGYYKLMDTILDINADNVCNDKIDLSQFNLRLYLREIEDINSNIKAIKLRKEVYYMQTQIGLYEQVEQYDLQNMSNCCFIELSKIINQTINIKDSKELSFISKQMKLYNERYKKALHRESFIKIKMKKISNN